MKILKYALLFLIVTVTSTASFSQGSNAAQNLNSNQNIKVIELRNYLVRHGRRDEYLVTVKNTLIVYPTEKSFLLKK